MAQIDFGMNFRTLVIALLLAFGYAGAGASRPVKRTLKKDTMAIVNAYIDSLKMRKLYVDSLAAEGAYNTGSDARYFKLFAPLTFYHSPAGKSLLLGKGGAGADSVNDEIDKALMDIYLTRPELVISTETGLRKAGSIRDDFDKPVRQEMELVDVILPEKDEPETVPEGLFIKKPNFWSFSGDSYLQVLQNYVSDNWYKGGESNYSMVANVTLVANYNNKRKLKFDNKLEMKLGFQTSPSDTLHKFKPSEDLIRYTGKVGLQAADRWYYTFQLLAYTQFARGLKSNDKKVYSDFMSPFNLNLGLGMDYSVRTKNNRLTGNINLSLLSFNFRYVDRKSLASRNGVRGDHHTLEDFGSQLTADLTWKISEQVKWKTRLYGYTTYRRALIEWENTFTIMISKYISSNIFLYPRFDDSAKKKDSDIGYWQFKEYCSFGFSYSF